MDHSGMDMAGMGGNGRDGYWRRFPWCNVVLSLMLCCRNGPLSNGAWASQVCFVVPRTSSV